MHRVLIVAAFAGTFAGRVLAAAVGSFVGQASNSDCEGLRCPPGPSTLTIGLSPLAVAKVSSVYLSAW